MKKVLPIFLILLLAGCYAQPQQAHDSNGGSCLTRPIQIVPVNYQEAPDGYDYVYETTILDGDCNVVDVSDEIIINIIGLHENPADVNRRITFWAVENQVVDSPHTNVAPHIPKVKHTVLGDSTVAFTDDMLDATGAEFIECAFYRNGQPVLNDIRAVGRAIKVIQPGQDTIVECHVAGDLD